MPLEFQDLQFEANSPRRVRWRVQFEANSGCGACLQFEANRVGLGRRGFRRVSLLDLQFEANRDVVGYAKRTQLTAPVTDWRLKSGCAPLPIFSCQTTRAEFCPDSVISDQIRVLAAARCRVLKALARKPRIDVTGQSEAAPPGLLIQQKLP
jgi:hypothetical protein